MNTHTIPERASWLTADVAFNPFDAVAAYEGRQDGQHPAVAAGLVQFLRRYVAKPLVRLYLRSRLIEELSHLSERSLNDIGMSRREILAAARRTYPLFDNGETGRPVPATRTRSIVAAAPKAAAANDDEKRQAA